MAKQKVSDAEFDRQYAAAVRRGQERMKTEPTARAVAYDRGTDRLVIDLRNGATFIVPCQFVQGLRGADPELLAMVKLRPRGAALRWDALDQDVSIAALIAGVFGTEAWMSTLAREMGRKGGKSTSDAKAASSRSNGRKGGRPPSRRIA